jgi:uncharacterized protein YrrD
MDRYFVQTIGTPVISEQGQMAGRVYDVIIDPETGKIAAFSLAINGKKVVAPIDVLSWGRQIIIHDAEDVVESGEIHKVSQILELQIPIIRNKVITKKGDYLGKVIDYSMEPKMFLLTSIVVAKGLLGILQWDRRIIGYKDIIEIKKGAIIVANNFGMETIKKFGVATPLA